MNFLLRAPRRAAAGACQVALVGAALLSPMAAPAQAPASGPAAASVTRAGEVQAVADGVWLLPGRFERDRQPDGNSLLLQGSTGLVVIDTGRHEDHAGALRDWARQRGQTIRVIVNTHWHLDHLGGNALLRDAAPGVRAYASAAVRDAVLQRMGTFDADLARMLQDPATDAATRRMIEVDRALYAQRPRLLPDEVLQEQAHDLVLAGRSLRVGVLRGVSGGDAWVLDRASGTLAIGDFVTLPVPFFDTACAERWRAALAQIDALPFERLVPGHGPVMGRGDFQRYRAAFEQLLTCAQGDQPVATCSAGWTKDLGPLLPAGSERVVQGMLQHYFGSHLRADAAERQRQCAG